MAIHDQAMKMELAVQLIKDSGLTEFHGLPTRTCLATGPDEASKIDRLARRIELLVEVEEKTQIGRAPLLLTL